MADKTLVFQSYRSFEPGSWIGLCLDSVHAWALRNGYSYIFLGDELFDPVPRWYRDRCGAQILPVTDLARLLHAARYLREGWDRVIWVDADVLVFVPERFAVDDRWSYALCHEAVVYRDDVNGHRIVAGVNNSVSLYRRANPFLGFYINACQSIVTNAHGPLEPLVVGTSFLTGLRRLVPFPLLATVGLFNEPVLDDLATGRSAFLRLLAGARPGPFYAANLCRSHGEPGRLPTAPVPQDRFAQAVDRLIATQGAAVNEVPAAAPG